MKVLVTDDSAMIRMILKGLLTQMEITDVVEATDGREALKILEHGSIDCLLLDVHMPNMDGLACLEEIRKNPATANLPVIIISSDTAPAQMERARELGAGNYIRKPFRIDGLKEAMSAVCPK